MASDDDPWLPRWGSFLLQMSYFLFDLFGLLIKLTCFHLILRKCGISNLIYLLVVQYLIGSVIVNGGWMVYQWFFFNPFEDNSKDSLTDWLFIQQMAEIMPYDLFQVLKL